MGKIAKKNNFNKKHACVATLSTSTPSSPKQQPQSLSSSSGNDSLSNADVDANGDADHDADGIDIDHKRVLTNGKSNGTAATENGTAASSVGAEPSYQNTTAIRTSRASSNLDADYENTTKNGLNGSVNGNGTASADGAAAAAAAAANNNNNDQSELVNGNGNGNATDADKKIAEHGKSSANAAGNKDELYDVPVGEFNTTSVTHTHIYTKKTQKTNTNKQTQNNQASKQINTRH